MRYRRSALSRRNPEDISVEGYFVAGTPHGFEFTTDDKPLCVICGAPLKHVFVTDRGLIGGDCLATLTGDDSSRAVLRRLKKFEGVPSRVLVYRAKQANRYDILVTNKWGGTTFNGVRSSLLAVLAGWAVQNGYSIEYHRGFRTWA